MDAAGRGRRLASHAPQKLRLGKKGAKADSGKAEELPSGWVRVASRSKPGAFFYAHQATKRTQAERPGAERTERAQGPKRPPKEHQRAAGSEVRGSSSRRGGDRAETGLVDAEVPGPPAAELVVDLEAEADRAAVSQAQAAALQQKAKAEAEAEEVAREEAQQKVRERRARAAQAEREDPLAESPEEGRQSAEPNLASASASTSAPVAARAPAGKSRRAGVRAGAANEGLGKKRRKAWNKEEKEEEGGEEEGGGKDVTQEELERWKEENEWRETTTEDASESEDEPEPKEPQKAEARREQVPQPEQIFEPCLDVLKSGLWVERHPLIGYKGQWTLGRSTGQVDILMQHESISREHATVVRKGTELFIADLGSAHGTLLDGRRLMTNALAKLQSGAQLRFGASSRVYVFHEPS